MRVRVMVRVRVTVRARVTVRVTVSLILRARRAQVRSAVVARRRAALRTALVLHGPLLAVTTREILGLCRAVRPTLALA